MSKTQLILDRLNESVDNNEYRYITNHGIGPGTLPQGTYVRSEALKNGKTAIYTNRPLTSEELNKYDIKPENIQESVENNEFNDEDEAAYYRYKNLYKMTNLARHRDAMMNAKRACKRKGINLEEAVSEPFIEALSKSPISEVAKDMSKLDTFVTNVFTDKEDLSDPDKEIGFSFGISKDKAYKFDSKYDANLVARKIKDNYGNEWKTAVAIVPSALVEQSTLKESPYEDKHKELLYKIFAQYPDISEDDEDYLNGLSYDELVTEVKNRGWDDLLEGAIEKEVLRENKSNLKEENGSNEYNYMLLDRLKQDCDYFLGNGNRNPKYLWAGSVDDQIAKMKELWNSFPDGEKPEWLSMEDIEDYENEMTDTTKGPEARKTIQDTLDRNWNKVNKIGIEESNINDMTLKEASHFDSMNFEQNIPHKMRFKEYDVVDYNNLYWVTQEPFSNKDLEEFANAFKNTPFTKAYVTVRDFSTYDFDKDKNANVFAIVDKKGVVDTSGYDKALKDAGWYNTLNEASEYNTKSKEEFDDKEEFKSAIHDDIKTIRNNIEELKNKLNTDESVEILNTYVDKIASEIIKKAYIN